MNLTSIIPQTEQLHVGTLNFLHNPENIDVRIESLLQEVKALNFDVLCLQEFQLDELEKVTALLKAEGYKTAYIADPIPSKQNVMYGVATFTKHEEASSFSLPSLLSAEKSLPFGITQLVKNGRNVHIINAHLNWGSFAEGQRLTQAVRASEYAHSVREDDPTSIILFMGDFNAAEDSSTVRYLYGKEQTVNGDSALWVDAYKMFGAAEDWVTSDPMGYWSKKTSDSVGTVYPQLTPKRRIDYLLSYEWAYGKPGSPLSFRRWADTLTGDEREVSDHFGLSSYIWVPPVK